MSETAIGSMPANGSSSRMNFGEMTSARVISAPRRGIEVHGLENREDVLFDRQAAENRRLLRQVADALPRADVHRIVGDVLAVELDAAGVGRGQADGHVKRRRLSGAVRAEESHDLS